MSASDEVSGDAHVEHAAFLVDLTLKQISQQVNGPVSRTTMCRRCHNPIGVERLKANPQAVLCRDCAAELEVQHKKKQRGY